MKYLWVALALVMLVGQAEAGGFADWAAVVVAGDSYSEDQKDTQVFDNGRIAIAKELLRIGFKPQNMRQFTDWPEHYPDTERATPKRIAKGLATVAQTAPGGCLVYLTSHGSPEGVGVGDYLLGMKTLKSVIAKACKARPAVIVVSACYSGVFVPYLKASNRIVLTAAAKDRSSFGCGATDRFTFFDECAVESLKASDDFVQFGKRAQACVAAREKKEQVDLPSHPQLNVGDTASAIPRWK